MEERNLLEKLVDLNLHLIVTRVMLMLDPPSLHAAKQVDFHADCNALGLSTMYNREALKRQVDPSNLYQLFLCSFWSAI